MTLTALSHGSVSFAIGSRSDRGSPYGRYAFQVAMRLPDTTEPKVGWIPTAASLDTQSRYVDGSLCELVTLAPTTSASRADDVRLAARASGIEPRLILGRWVDGAMVIDDSQGAFGGSTGFLTLKQEPGVRRVLGVCGSGIGDVTVVTGAPGDVIAAPPVADAGRLPGLPDASPTEAADQFAKAFPADAYDVEVSYRYLSRADSVTHTFDLPVTREAAVMVLTNRHDLVPTVHLLLSACDERCRAWAASNHAGVVRRDVGVAIALRPDTRQLWAQTHQEGWLFESVPLGGSDTVPATVEVTLHQHGEVQILTAAKRAP